MRAAVLLLPLGLEQVRRQAETCGVTIVAHHGRAARAYAGILPRLVRYLASSVTGRTISAFGGSKLTPKNGPT